MSFPVTIDTAEDLLIAINNFSTTCVGVLSSGQTSIAIKSATNLPPSGLVSIDNEIIYYAFINGAGANPVLSNCSRGFDNTIAAQHGDNSKVEMRWVARHHNLLSATIRLLEAVLGVQPQAGFVDMAARLANELPLVLQIPNQMDWSFNHSRKRIVGVQLWRLNTGTGNYDLFTAPIDQDLDVSGVSTVTIQLSTAEQGFIVVT